MPHIVGWKDFEQTIIYMASQKAATIRVFVPGYTKLTRIALPAENIVQELNALVLRLQNIIQTPVIVEPAMLDSLDAVIEGVMTDSPAYRASLKSGDRITSIDNKAVYSRVDAYNRLYTTAKSEVCLERDGRPMSFAIEKDKDSSAGLVFNYDIDPKAAEGIKRKVEKFRGEACLILVSKLGYGIISKVLKSHENLEIKIAANSYFGGNIMCAGLLVLQDIEDALKREAMPLQVVFLPQIMFDEKGRDLTGRHYMELEQEFDVTVVVI
jgi:hypothetical protein